MRLHSHRAIRSFLTACAAATRQMHSTTFSGPEREAEGVIRTVDPIGRELTVSVNGTSLTFYVPLDCPIMLNEERVKMRLLQPMDRAFVRYNLRAEHPVACWINVDWETHQAESEVPRVATGQGSI